MENMTKPARVLIIAGSDSGGGAGIQGDIKTITVLGGYAATAITAITVQNTLGVSQVHPLPAALVAAQIAAVLDDIGADAIKIGMLGSADVIAAVADALACCTAPIVLDPVMVAKGGARLLAPDAERALLDRLVPTAAVITPNAPELAALTGLPVTNEDEAQRAGHALAARGPAVVVKGGHLPADPDLGILDLIILSWGEASVRSPQIDTRHTHGTGCAFASAMATRIAQGLSIAEAFVEAHNFVAAAIRAAPGLGAGHGPLGFLEGARSLGD